MGGEHVPLVCGDKVRVIYVMPGPESAACPQDREAGAIHRNPWDEAIPGLVRSLEDELIEVLRREEFASVAVAHVGLALAISSIVVGLVGARKYA